MGLKELILLMFVAIPVALVAGIVLLIRLLLKRPKAR